MIRMILFAAGFVAITIALVILQPGAPLSGNDVMAPADPVTRANPALSPALSAQSAGSGDADDRSFAFVPAPAQNPAPSASASLDDQSLRKMTWQTLSGLNHATGRESAPGQPGSLLHTIVRRSLDEGPQANVVAAAPAAGGQGVYVVQSGDSLVSIAERIYGDVNMTGPLFAANQATLTRPDDLREGQTLVLPIR